MEEKNIKTVVSYDGTAYEGWQYQPGRSTIQGTIEEKLSLILCAPVKVIASGRTDAGVHALKQTAHFRTSSSLSPDAILKGLNSLLKDDIRVKSARYVHLDFHARYSAISKLYEFYILNRPEPDIFRRAFQWHIRAALDISAMASCLKLIEGRHDFTSFRSSGSANVNPVRNVLRAELTDRKDGLLAVAIEADGFLRHMVRNIVGTVVEAGLGKLTPLDFANILEGRDRKLAGPNAPARGLFLVEVRYAPGWELPSGDNPDSRDISL